MNCQRIVNSSKHDVDELERYFSHEEFELLVSLIIRCSSGEFTAVQFEAQYNQLIKPYEKLLSKPSTETSNDGKQ